MNLMVEILIQSMVILTLVAGILGIILSSLLLLSPEKTRQYSERLDYWIHVDEKLAILDRDIDTGRLIDRYPRIVGGFLLLGGVILLIILCLKLDAGKMSKLFFSDSSLLPLSEVLLGTAVIVGKLAGVVGIVLSIFMLFGFGNFRKLERVMAYDLTSKPFVEKLNAFHGGIDTIFLKYPMVFGSAGLAASMVLAYWSWRQLLLFTG